MHMQIGTCCYTRKTHFVAQNEPLLSIAIRLKLEILKLRLLFFDLTAKYQWLK